MAKSDQAYRTISEVSQELDIPAHVLRFWEQKFHQLKPMKRNGGRRFYRPDDIALIQGLKTLLHDEGYTIKGVQRVMREQGVGHVVSWGERRKDEPQSGKTVARALPMVGERERRALNAALTELERARKLLKKAR